MGPDPDQLELIPSIAARSAGSDGRVMTLSRSAPFGPAGAGRLGAGGVVPHDLRPLRRAAAVEGKEFHEAQALRLAVEVEARLRSLGGPSTDAFDQLLAAATGSAAPGDCA